MTFMQFLQYLASGGAVILAAAFVSWLAENVPLFQKLASAVKQLVMVGTCLVLALGAWAIQRYVPAATLADLSAPFGIVMATVAGLLANQVWHKLVNKAAPTIDVQTLAPLILPPAAPKV